MNKQSEKKKEAPGMPDQQDKIELPGAEPNPPKKEKEEEEKEDPEPVGEQGNGNSNKQSGPNTSPGAEN